MNKFLLMSVVSLLLCVGVQAEEAQFRFAQPVKKIMILGNSITRHGIKHDIGWHINCGMAASSEDKDFAHILLARVKEANGGTAAENMIGNIATFERQHATMDIPAFMKAYYDFKPEILVLAINENVANLATPEQQTAYREGLKKMLQPFKDGGTKLYARSSFWPNAVKDGILREVTEWYGGVYVDISALAKDQGSYARSERHFDHQGVANHPGDKGMLGIADYIWKAMTK